MNNVTRCSLEEAVELVKKSLTPEKKIEEVSLMDALGRVLAKDVYAGHSQPPFPRSPLDGYAFNAKDSEGAKKDKPVMLKVVDEVFAGGMSSHIVQTGEAVRIMTGAPIPEGADCVIRQEDTNYGEETVEIYHELKAFDNYCFIGEDYKEGDKLLLAGTKLHSAEIGMLASLGKTTVEVLKMPEIHLITTGDELVMPGECLRPGKIYDSNLYTIGMRLLELGYKVNMHENVEDSPQAVAKQIEKAAKTADLVITTGGVSVGKKDIMHEVLEILKADRLFWKINLKPGTPTLCAKYNHTLLIGLSGNPFGAVTNLEVFVRPVLSYLSGDPSITPVKTVGVLQDEFLKSSKVRRFVRGVYQEGKVFLPQGSHSSGVLSSLCGCNCLLDIPAGSTDLQAGSEVAVWKL